MLHLHCAAFHLGIYCLQSTYVGVSALKGKRSPNNKRIIIDIMCLSNQFAANHVKIYQEIKKLYVFEVSIISLIMPSYL